jgi:hydrogenase maturation protein HypF
MGRLFDAVAALLGIRFDTTYEAQAASELEAAAWSWARQATPAELAATTAWALDRELTGEPVAVLRELLTDVLDQRRSLPQRAARFHFAVAQLLAAVLDQQAQAKKVDFIGCSGGVALNRLLMRQLSQALEQRQRHLLTHRRLPPNDGSLCVGQTVAALMSARPG